MKLRWIKIFLFTCWVFNLHIVLGSDSSKWLDFSQKKEWIDKIGMLSYQCISSTKFHTRRKNI